jgi:hypothetical protein
MKDTIRIQFETADGIKQYARMPRSVLKERIIWRRCLKIIRIDGEERPMDQTIQCSKRGYRLWTQLPNGTFVFHEDF